MARPHHNAEQDLAAHTSPRQSSRLGAAWIGLTVFVIVLILLLVFILQNAPKVTIHYLGASGHVSLGILVLIGATAGIVLALLIGSLRLVQVRIRTRHS